MTLPKRTIIQSIIPACFFLLLLSSCGGSAESPEPIADTIHEDTTILVDFPKFPWPPPRASATVNIPNHLLMNQGQSTTLADVATKLESVMQQAGYAEISYFSAPGGYAIASRIEQINDDGVPKEPPARWSLQISKPGIFSLKEYLLALFTAPKGRFRVIVWIVTNKPFVQNSDKITPEEAMEWVRSGATAIPKTLGELTYTGDYRTTALIYEFEKSADAAEAIVKAPSSISGQDHLIKSNIWKGLQP